MKTIRSFLLLPALLALTAMMGGCGKGYILELSQPAYEYEAVLRAHPMKDCTLTQDQLIRTNDSGLFGRHAGKAIVSNMGNECPVRVYITGNGIVPEICTLQPGRVWEKAVPLAVTSSIQRFVVVEVAAADNTCEGGAMGSGAYNDFAGAYNMINVGTRGAIYKKSPLYK